MSPGAEAACACAASLTENLINRVSYRFFLVPDQNKNSVDDIKQAPQDEQKHFPFLDGPFWNSNDQSILTSKIR